MTAIQRHIIRSRTHLIKLLYADALPQTRPLCQTLSLLTRILAATQDVITSAPHTDHHIPRIRKLEIRLPNILSTTSAHSTLSTSGRQSARSRNHAQLLGPCPMPILTGLPRTDTALIPITVLIALPTHPPLLQTLRPSSTCPEALPPFHHTPLNIPPLPANVTLAPATLTQKSAPWTPEAPSPPNPANHLAISALLSRPLPRVLTQNHSLPRAEEAELGDRRLEAGV